VDTTGNKIVAALREKAVRGAYGTEGVRVMFMTENGTFPRRIFLSYSQGPMTFDFGMLPDQARLLATYLTDMANAIDSLNAATVAIPE